MIAFLGVMVRLGAMAGLGLVLVGLREAVRRVQRRRAVRRGLTELEQELAPW